MFRWLLGISLIWILSVNVYGAKLDPVWYETDHPDTKSDLELPELEDNKELVSFVNELELEQDKALAEIEANNKEVEKAGTQPRWRFERLRTILGLGLSGNLGLLSWGGTKTVEIIWAKKQDDKETQFNDDEAQKIDQNIHFEDKNNWNDVDDELQPFIAYLIKSGKVKQETTLRDNLIPVVKQFYLITKAATEQEQSNWNASRIRLDLAIAASGMVVPPFASIGGDVRLTLEWRPRLIKKSIEVSDATLTPLQKNMALMLEQMSAQVAEAADKDAHLLGFEPALFRVAIGVTAKGDVGLFTGSMGITPFIDFERNPNVPRKPTLIDAYDDIFMIGDNKSGDHEATLISAKRVQKGLKKAVRFGRKFTGLFRKKALAVGQWHASEVWVNYRFSVSGDVGLVNLKLEPFLEVIFRPRSKI